MRSEWQSRLISEQAGQSGGSARTRAAFGPKRIFELAYLTSALGQKLKVNFPHAGPTARPERQRAERTVNALLPNCLRLPNGHCLSIRGRQSPRSRSALHSPRSTCRRIISASVFLTSSLPFIRFETDLQTVSNAAVMTEIWSRDCRSGQVELNATSHVSLVGERVTKPRHSAGDRSGEY